MVDQWVDTLPLPTLHYPLQDMVVEWYVPGRQPALQDLSSMFNCDWNRKTRSPSSETYSHE